jgi:hypothetical protein
MKTCPQALETRRFQDNAEKIAASFRLSDDPIADDGPRAD